VVDNRPGANGTLAVQELLRSPNDGHALLVSSNAPIVINPSLYRRLPYRPADLQPLVPLARASLAVVVNSALGVRSLGELIALLKSRPGKFSYGSPGQGSTSHMVTTLFAQAIGADLTHVPYKGSGAALTDLIGGQLHLMIDALPSCLPHVRSGRLIALAVTGEKSSIHLPQVPTCASQGVHGLPAGGWYGAFARASIDPNLGVQISGSLREVVALAGFTARANEQAFEPLEMTPTGFQQLVHDDSAFWKLTTRRLNLYQLE
jgi:tripartite-type tricarboxylate transporter receptor subunit TctC